MTLSYSKWKAPSLPGCWAIQSVSWRRVNAPVESFFATLKRELVHRGRYNTRAEARADQFEYIEVWYNRRRHSALGYFSPAAFERRAAVSAMALPVAA